MPDRAVIERKLGYLNRYVRDLAQHALLDDAGRRQAHYAIERLLQLLCDRDFAAWCIARLDAGA